MKTKQATKGFTIVELLIVIVVIGILAAITIVAYNGIQSRSRDARRAQDFATIHKALLSYAAIHDGLPSTVSSSAYTNGVVYGGWDASNSPNWLAFLRPSHGNMPIDPANTLSVLTNPPDTTNRVYFYYCWPPGGPYSATESMVRVGYTKENGTAVDKRFAVSRCL